jgi:hypothetical protein
MQINALPFCLATAVLCLAGAPPVPATRPEPVSIAIVVHPACGISGLTSAELKTYLELEREFWPDKKKIALLQRSASSVEQKALLKTVYRTDERSLRKMWVQKLYQGKIGAIPSVVVSNADALKLLANLEGGITAVCVTGVPADGVKVLTVDGKLPGQEGYPLLWTE